MQFAFFGTPAPARETLDILKEHGYMPTVIVTNPDAPRGRGNVLTPSETKVWADEHNILVLTPASLDEETITAIKAYDCDLAVVVAYGKIFPEALIDAFPKGAINVHYSLLPQYRGAAPVETALLNNETMTGVTIQQMAPALDAGDILVQEEEPISSSDTTVELRKRLVLRGGRLLASLLPRMSEGTVTTTPQDDTAATYAPKLKKENAEIDLSGPAEENWNKYRAFKEWSGVYFFANAKMRVKITDATFSEDGTFMPRRVIPEGKKEMDYDTFLRSQKE